MKTRKAGLAGSWYPDSASACGREIQAFLKGAPTRPEPTAVGGIVPHAGWFFSGRIACNVIHRIGGDEAQADENTTYAVFGMHLGAASPAHILPEGAWETPMGPLAVDEDMAGALMRRFDFHVESAGSYTRDNTIELQLPFIKHFSPEARILPVGVPPNESAGEIGAAVVEIARELGRGLRIIGSTDLTHYGTNYGFMPKGSGPTAIDWVRKGNDRRIIDLMLDMDPDAVVREALHSHNACCAGAAAAAMTAARGMGATRAEELAYATSYDKHPGDSFVGYVGVVFHT
jgi:AmmeMemoRadiSam system protein B